MRNLWKFVTGFSIKIWLKFFGAVFLQPCFFAPKSLKQVNKKDAFLHQEGVFFIEYQLFAFKSFGQGLLQQVLVNKTVGLIP